MLARVSCDHCSVGSLWTDDPPRFLASACRRPERCRAKVVADGEEALPETDDPADGAIDPLWLSEETTEPHICHTFGSARDLTTILVPYFRSGLERNEQCIWVTGGPLSIDLARSRLAAVVPGLDELERGDRLRILDRADWYRPSDFDPERVVETWLSVADDASRRGFSGLRVSGTVIPDDEDRWPRIMRYERLFDEALRSHPIRAFCSYPTELFRPADLLHHHDFAVVGTEDSWWACSSASEASARLEA